MKKILSMLTICCVSLLAGVFLCSCSNDAYNVQFSMDEKTEQYVELGFSTAGEKIEIGEKKKAKELAIKLYKKGSSLETISELIEVPVSQLEEWLELQAVWILSYWYIVFA